MREVVVIAGCGGSLTLGERMRQALEGDTTFFSAALMSGKSEIDENTAGCGDGDGGIGATTARGAEVSTNARETGARVASGFELATGLDM